MANIFQARDLGYSGKHIPNKISNIKKQTKQRRIFFSFGQTSSKAWLTKSAGPAKGVLPSLETVYNIKWVRVETSKNKHNGMFLFCDRMISLVISRITGNGGNRCG